jgi:hypothetical protein
MVKKRWGLWVFLTISLASLAKLAWSPVVGHYQIFIGATRALINGESPYFNTFNSPSGTWLYSPSCGLYFFRIFEWMPDRLGQWAFVALSWVVLFWGFWAFFEKSKTFEALRANPLAYNLFWLLSANEVIGAIANTRLEIVMVGVLLLSASHMQSLTATNWLSGIAIAKITLWKFVSLPSAALLMLVKPRALVPSLILGFLIFVLLPVAQLGLSQGLNLHQVWLSAIKANAIGEGSASQPVWLSFVHLYRTAYRVFDYQPQYFMAQLAGAAVAIGLAVFTVLKARKVEWALALGAFFSTALMPASQSAGYIQWLPLLGLGFLLASTSSGRQRRVMQFALAISFFFVSFLSSDFVPKAARAFSADYALKAVGSLVLVVSLMAHRLSSSRGDEGLQSRHF